MPEPDKATPRILWKPKPEWINSSRLTRFAEWLEKHHALRFDDYHDLWTWSVEEPARFWACIWAYFQLGGEGSYRQVLSRDPMPDTRWFEGSHLNYSGQIFRRATGDRPAILFRSEDEPLKALGWEELRIQVVGLQQYFLDLGLQPGDRVAAFLPNAPEATIAFLAASTLGLVWSSCSPDFGAESVIDRFRQIEPKVLIGVTGYRYGGKYFDRNPVLRRLMEELPSVISLIRIPGPGRNESAAAMPRTVTWERAISSRVGGKLVVREVPFEHPLWVLYSSGTTGAPKAITHSHGGVLLEHLKYLHFHNDVKEGERFFWYTTTGWMMWNYVQGALLCGATIVLYDGSPAWPDAGILWSLAQDAPIHHFGTSAPFLVHGMRTGLEPGKSFDLSALRSISSTGSPLPPEAFDWCYEAVKPDLWLVSMSGGTDVCTAFVGGCPWEPVYEGEIQCRALGCALYAFNAEGKPVIDEVGEMVITRPMPSMPIFFWNDPGKKRYRESYFAHYPGLWRHGDWVRVTPRHTLVIYGRSDATLNRQGVRIGTAEIYRALHAIPAIRDSLIVNLELAGGKHFMPLFVVMREDVPVDEALKQEIKRVLREQCSPRHVPDAVIRVPDIPYTLSGKKLEAPIKKILMGTPMEKAVKKDALRNPEAVDFFLTYGKSLKQP